MTFPRRKVDEKGAIETGNELLFRRSEKARSRKKFVGNKCISVKVKPRVIVGVDDSVGVSDDSVGGSVGGSVGVNLKLT